MRSLITTALVIISFNSFAGNLDVSSLDCTVNHPQPNNVEKEFRLQLKFESVISAINDSGLDKTQKADLTITYSIGEGKNQTVVINNISLRQSTSAYGYELAFNAKVLGSQYNSFFSLSPKFKGFLSKSVSSFDGLIELNGLIENYDSMLIKTEYLTCTPSL
ncbi:MAG: hypothetical protein A2381_09350 [Bdellovibrionales bacterium RIFOXYB1_FULL_37_110]|nr:MAG: hypothetical protein A2417_14390 [Bdellovibrionales bacterium RIFOXYC1_FULL_37_79]OFZ56883.1 MAG: hypothetical protein A2381_09350 [Bdellovibrionales bacterium RIFOXYB1_FULL_37_110]OFZ65569.1 MAG: hypothetical protein A2577_17305 [Bdellovibrionales bacterium RIFOXYD1_FULL_36_51]